MRGQSRFPIHIDVFNSFIYADGLKVALETSHGICMQRNALEYNHRVSLYKNICT